MIYGYDRSNVITLAQVGGESILVKREDFNEKFPTRKYPFILIHSRINTDSGVEASIDAKSDNRPGGFYPKGDLEPLHQLQSAVNTTINQRFDNITLNLRNPMIVEEGAFVDEHLLARGWINNPIIHAKKVDIGGRTIRDRYDRFQVPDMFGSAFGHQLEKFEVWGDRAVATPEAVRGEGDPDNQTKGGFLQATANSMQRTALQVYVMATMGMAEMLTMMSDMNAYTIGADHVLYITGIEGGLTKINPRDVATGVAYTIRTIPPFSKAMMGKQAMEFLLFSKEHYPWVDVKRLMQIILEGQEWLETADEIIPDNAPSGTFIDLQILAAQQLQPPPVPEEGSEIDSQSDLLPEQVGGIDTTDAEGEVRQLAQAPAF